VKISHVHVRRKLGYRTLLDVILRHLGVGALAAR
jgi:hypothetical protein